MIDNCYECGMELDWAVHYINWRSVPFEGVFAFCDSCCNKKKAPKKELGQLSFDI